MKPYMKGTSKHGANRIFKHNAKKVVEFIQDSANITAFSAPNKKKKSVSNEGDTKQ